MTNAPAELCRRVVHPCDDNRHQIEKAGDIRRPFVLLCTTSKHYLRFLAAFFAPPFFFVADLRPDFFVADFFFLVAMIHSPLNRSENSPPDPPVDRWGDTTSKKIRRISTRPPRGS
jgi:hypothetical protein